MDYLSRIGIFIEVAKHESFAGAARALGITSSAVSKQIQNLEHELQVKLLNRTTRKVSVTEEGALFFDRASRALEDIQEAKEQIHELKSCPRGTLKVSLPFSLGTKYLSHQIALFVKKYPDVELDTSFDDRIVDVAGEEFDVAIRIGVLEDSALIARRLASCPFIVCASPGYIANQGRPNHPDDLVNHNVFVYTRNRGIHEWRYKGPDGKEGQIRLHGRFKSDSGEMMCEAALQGLGVTILPVFYVAEYLKAGKLEAILPDFATWPARNIYAIFQPSRYLSTRLRLFVDHLTTACKELPWEQHAPP